MAFVLFADYCLTFRLVAANFSLHISEIIIYMLQYETCSTDTSADI